MGLVKTSALTMVLLVLAVLSSAAAACVVTYTDYSVGSEEEEILAWSWVEDYFDTGSCFWNAYYQWGWWTHLYHASVTVTSPTQNIAENQKTVGWVTGGGGAALAFAVISTTGDPGYYDLGWINWIQCNVGGLFVHEIDTEQVDVNAPPSPSTDPPPPPPCASGTDTVAISEMLSWPLQEPFERGALLRCAGSTAVVATGSYRDSFGEVYPPGLNQGYTPTEDPCSVVFLLFGPQHGSLQSIAAIHSHPYFLTKTEHNRGVGCRQYKIPESYPVWQWSIILYSLNLIYHREFSAADRIFVADSGIPLYMRTPQGDQILRLDYPGTSLNPPVVWP